MKYSQVLDSEPVDIVAAAICAEQEADAKERYALWYYVVNGYRPYDPEYKHPKRTNKEYVDAQKQFSHTLSMPKLSTNFCPLCPTTFQELVPVVVSEVLWLNTYLHQEKRIKTCVAERIVYNKIKRVVKGKYVLQNHRCTL